RDLLLRELAHHLLDGLLVVGELEVHASGDAGGGSNSLWRGRVSRLADAAPLLVPRRRLAPVARELGLEDQARAPLAPVGLGEEREIAFHERGREGAFAP